MVSEMENELREISHSQKKETKIHHALNQDKINIQSENVVSLAATFDIVKLQFAGREDLNLYNILTGRLYKDNVKRDILSIHVKGKQLYKEFIDERLQRESTISIWAPLKESKIKRNEKQQCKGSLCHRWQITSTRERHCDLFRTIAVLNTVPGSNISIKEIIGNYACCSLARSLFDANGLPNTVVTQNQIWYMQFGSIRGEIN